MEGIFYGVIGRGVEGRVVIDGRGKREGRGEEEMDINREEVREAIKRLRMGRHWDKIPGEA